MLLKEVTRKDATDDEEMDGLLAVREVAQLLHVHPNTLRRWSNNGRIAAYRITPRGDRRFRREDVARLLLEFSVNSDTSAKAP